MKIILKHKHSKKQKQKHHASAERVILTKDKVLGSGEKMLVLNHVSLCLLTNL